MKFAYALLGIIGFAIAGFSFCSKPDAPSPPKAIGGVIDLRAWNFEKDGPVKLDGEWEFYWKQLLTPDDFNRESGTKGRRTHAKGQLAPGATGKKDARTPGARARDTIKVPGSWNAHIPPGNPGPIGGDGYATYRLKMRLGQNRKELGVKILSIFSSYRLYINGALVSEAGKVGTSEKETIHAMRPRIIIIPENSAADVELIFHLSNFSQASGGMRNQVHVGKAPDLNAIRQNRLFLDVFLFGSLLMMSLYHFGLYLLRRSDRSALYFGIFSLIMAIRPLFLDEKLIMDIFSRLPYELSMKIEYLTICLAGAFKESELSRRNAEEQKKIADSAKLEIEKLSRIKDEFLANLSHELKTPLSAVHAYSEMLTDGKDYPDKVTKYSRKIFDGARKLNDYVSDLILLTDIESNLQLQKAPVDMQDLLGKLMKQTKSLQEEKEIQLDFRTTENMVFECDPTLLEKALAAILKNAIVFNRQKGKIVIELNRMEPERGPAEIRIKIADTGIGISAENRERIFEKFFRVDSALTYEASGVGVGLYLAKRIIELHGGSIEVESEPGTGSVFLARLPKSEGESQ